MSSGRKGIPYVIKVPEAGANYSKNWPGENCDTNALNATNEIVSYNMV